MTDQNDGLAGHSQTTDAGSDANAMAGMFKNLISQVHTATLVKVVKVSNNGGLTAVGTVDVLPLVNQIDGAGAGTPHVNLYSLPYFRLQGGTNAVILDPQVGDIGLAVFASRDTSKVRATGQPANPGSRRRFSMSDGQYFGGFLNGVPVQYIRFASDGIEVVSPTEIKLTSPKVTIASAAVVVNGASLKHNAKNIGDTHTHSGVQAGGGTSGAPT